MEKTIVQRIAAVIDRLRPETVLTGSYQPACRLEERMAAYHTPGVSIAVVNEGRLEWARAFGLRQAGRAARVTPRTLFQAASISKLVLGLAVMCLVEEGRLELDRDVNDYLTSWQVPANQGWQPQVTLRQLLSHTAGVNVSGFPGYPASAAIPSVRQVLNGAPPANTERIRVDILPGLQYRYSGGGFTIAQQVVADVLGRPAAEILRERVLEPLGMVDSTFDLPLPPALARRAASAHPLNGIPLRGKWNVYPELAAAGLWTTAADLARLGMGMMNALHGQPGSLLTMESARAMLRHNAGAPDSPEAMAHHMISWAHEREYAGLAFRFAGQGRNLHFGHSGSNEGFVSIMNFYPELGRGAAVMLNSQAYDLFNEIFAAIARAYEWPDFLPPDKPDMTLAEPAAYAGAYRGPGGETFLVIDQSGSLQLQLAGQPPLALVPAGELKFFARGLAISAVFEKDERGQCQLLLVSQEGRSWKAVRQS
jgi:CubicO group peptidase (beta-lactamase class C family)